MTLNSFRKISFLLTAVVLSGTLYLSTTYATLAPLTPPPSGGYDAGTNSILDPGCTPTDVDCFVKEFQGWKLTGNAGTTVGTNFIGTTDAEDFMIKTNGAQIVLFGQNGKVAIGSANVGLGLAAPIASGVHSFASGIGSIASGSVSTAFGLTTTASGDYATAFGVGSVASGDYATAFGEGATASGSESLAFNNGSVASGDRSIAFGNGGSVASGQESNAFGRETTASGDRSTTFGYLTYAKSYFETAFGSLNTDYMLSTFGSGSFDLSDRQFSIGNGTSIGNEHNAYTLWKDGSFAYNDDNFQNDDPGTDQSMFYFNFGNHDGLGNTQTKRAIRLGSTTNGEWDINNANVGDSSIAIGFSIQAYGVNAPIASGTLSTAIGGGSIASGDGSFAIGGGTASNIAAFALDGEASGVGSKSFGAKAIGDYSYAFGFSTGEARGLSSFVMTNSTGIAYGNNSFAIGLNATAYSFAETAFGLGNTSYTPVDATDFDLADRLFIVGGGGRDVFTLLKSGQTGIGINNFEANTNGSIFQVGDTGTNIIAYVDNSTGAWVAVSDERQKHNIGNLTYGLDSILQLRPVSFNYNRNNEHTIGFLAQQVKDIIPEVVFGDEVKGYGMSYATLTPALVSAIQEMNLNITQISDTTRTNTWRDALIAWFGNVGNGITKLFVREIETKTLCVADDSGSKTCITKYQLDQLLNGWVSGSIIPAPVSIITPDPVTNTDPGIDSEIVDIPVDTLNDTDTPVTDVQVDTPLESPVDSPVSANNPISPEPAE